MVYSWCFFFIDTVLIKAWRRKQSWRPLSEVCLPCDCTSLPYSPFQVTLHGLIGAVIVNFFRQLYIAAEATPKNTRNQNNSVNTFVAKLRPAL
jgi:hypothetical protein